MTRVIVSHVLDVGAEPPVYRLVHAEAVQTVGPMLDGEGNVLLDDTDRPITEERVEFVDPVEIVFAADDDRWFTGQGRNRKRRKDADVTAEQRQAIKDAIDATERVATASPSAPEAEGSEAEAASEPASQVVALPGVGEEL